MRHVQEHPELGWRQKMLLEFRAERKVLAENARRTASLLSIQQDELSGCIVISVTLNEAHFVQQDIK